MAELKSLVRWIAVAASIVLLAPLWFPARFERALHREGFFAGCSELLSLLPGRLGVFLRRAFYRMTLDRCAVDVHIGFGTTLAHPQVCIDRGVYVGNRCTLGMCILEENATIGSNVDLLSGRRQHEFEDATRSLQDQGGTFTTIRLGANCWVGNRAVVMADVGARAVVGAGAVVVHAIPAGATAVGNPATVKRLRAVA